MDIKKKFEIGFSNKTYQRIDSDFKVNIFLGYNERGQMSMVITEPGKSSNVKPSKFIDVIIRQREDGKLLLEFALLDNTYKSLFLIFCKDIISICELAGSNMAISNAITRWKYWKEMFGKKRDNLLSESEIQGLIGELLVLKNYFLETYEENKAYNSWLGPLGNKKDFEVDDTWYEVKSILEGVLKVEISSLEQLDSDKEGNLAVVKLSKTSNTTQDHISLNKLVMNLLLNIEDPEIRELFISRLEKKGYSTAPEYDNYCYLLKNITYYTVNDDFPKLIRSQIDEAIGTASYSILLNGITNFKRK